MKPKTPIWICGMILIIGLLPSLAYASPVREYNLTLSTEANITLSKMDINVKEMQDYSFNQYGEYLWEISANGKVLNYSFFNVVSHVHYDIFDNETGEIIDGGQSNITLASIEVYIPYYENANKITISKYNQTTEEKTPVLDIDISMYAKSINITEKEKKEEISGENISIEEITTEKKSNILVYLLAGIIVALIILLIKWKRKNK